MNKRLEAVVSDIVKGVRGLLQNMTRRSMDIARNFPTS
jgi:hypothetical protein